MNGAEISLLLLPVAFWLAGKLVDYALGEFFAVCLRCIACALLPYFPKVVGRKKWDALVIRAESAEINALALRNAEKAMEEMRAERDALLEKESQGGGKWLN